MQDLNELVQLPEKVILVGAVAINDNGWIVGNAVDANQHLHAFLLIPNTNNDKPVANAGPNQSVALGDVVNLNGTGSYDANGGQLSLYLEFRQRAGGKCLGGFRLKLGDPFLFAGYVGNICDNLGG